MIWDVQHMYILYASGPWAEILHELRCGSGPNLINLCRYTEITIVNLAKTSVYINCMSWGEISLINCLRFRIGLNVHFSFVKAEQQFQNENDFGGKKTKTKGNKWWHNVVYCEGFVSIYISPCPKCSIIEVPTPWPWSSDFFFHILTDSSFQPRRNCQLKVMLKLWISLINVFDASLLDLAFRGLDLGTINAIFNTYNFSLLAYFWPNFPLSLNLFPKDTYFNSVTLKLIQKVWNADFWAARPARAGR